MEVFHALNRFIQQKWKDGNYDRQGEHLNTLVNVLLLVLHCNMHVI